MSDDRVPLGEINMARPDREPPLFKIIRGYDRHLIPPKDRPCDHPSFTLDERWRVVRCAKCDERIDAFAVLMRFAEWWGKFEHRRWEMEHAERRVLVAELRRLRRLRGCTQELRVEIDRAIREAQSFGTGARARAMCDNLIALADRVQKAIRGAA